MSPPQTKMAWVCLKPLSLDSKRHYFERHFGFKLPLDSVKWGGEGVPFWASNALLRALNLQLGHVQFFFDNGTNAGASIDEEAGTDTIEVFYHGKGDPELAEYKKLSRVLYDRVLRQAICMVVQGKGLRFRFVPTFGPVGSLSDVRMNCQAWSAHVLRIYDLLLREGHFHGPDLLGLAIKVKPFDNKHSEGPP